MLDRLTCVAAFALVSVSLVNGVKIDTQADLTVAYLCDDQVNRSWCAYMCGQDSIPGPDSKPEELSSVFGRFPRFFPFNSHALWDGEFHGCC